MIFRDISSATRNNILLQKSIFQTKINNFNKRFVTALKDHRNRREDIECYSTHHDLFVPKIQYNVFSKTLFRCLFSFVVTENSAKHDL